jgi:hypothetical protein
MHPQGIKRAGSPPQPETSKTAKTEPLRWSVTALERISRAEAIRELSLPNLVDLFRTLNSPFLFTASFPEGLSLDLIKRVLKAARDARLFSAEKLAEPFLSQILSELDEACTMGRPSIAIALIEGGVPVTWAHVQNSINFPLPEVLLAILELPGTLSTSWISAILGFLEKTPNRELALAIVRHCFPHFSQHSLPTCTSERELLEKALLWRSCSPDEFNQALIHNWMAAVTLLLNQNPEYLNRVNANGYTPLIATSHSKEGLHRGLMGLDAKVGSKIPDNILHYHSASLIDIEYILKQLPEDKRRFLLNFPDEKGNTAFLLYCRLTEDDSEIVDIFDEWGAQLDAVNHKDETALHLLTQGRSRYADDFMKRLLELKPDLVNQLDREGQTPLDLLLKKRADIEEELEISCAGVGSSRSGSNEKRFRWF